MWYFGFSALASGKDGGPYAVPIAVAMMPVGALTGAVAGGVEGSLHQQPLGGPGFAGGKSASSTKPRQFGVANSTCSASYPTRTFKSRALQITLAPPGAPRD
jgi:hypothetical protein